MEIYRITSQTLPGFLPLIPEEYQELLASPDEIYALGAEEDHVGCGVLIFQASEFQLQILWLEVADDYRRRGVAREMIRWLCRYGDKEVIPVTCVFSSETGREPIYLLFESLTNFTVAREEGVIFSISAEQLDSAPLLKKAGKFSQTIYPVFELPRQLQRKLLRGEISLAQQEADYVPQLCLCTLDRDGEEATAAVLFQPGQQADELYLSYAFCRPEAARGLLSLFARAAAEIRRDFPDCRTIRIAAATPAAEAMVSKLFPDARQTAGYFMACWDMVF